MHIKDVQILQRLAQAVEQSSLAQDFPPGAPGTLYAYALGFKHGEQKPFPDFRGVSKSQLIKEMDDWPLKDLLEFIRKKGDSFPDVVYGSLLEMIDSTETLGAEAIHYLTDLEIKLSQGRRAEPREALVARYVETYGGRINLIPALTGAIKQHFSTSQRIDQALARHVSVHQLGDRSFNDVARTSDLLCSIPGFRETLRACITCLQSHDSEWAWQYFKDSIVGAIPADILDIHCELFGHDKTLVMAGKLLPGCYRADHSGFDVTFWRLVEKFGAVELLNTEGMKQDFESDEIAGHPSRFFMWYAKRMSVDAPEITELTIPQVPAMIRNEGQIPCTGFMIAWRQAREPEMFLAEYFMGVAGRIERGLASLKYDAKFRDYARLLPVRDDGLPIVSLQALVHAAYAPGSGFNEVSLSIKTVLAMAGVEAMSKLVPDLTSQSLHGMVRQKTNAERGELMKFYPKAGEFVMGVDLGL